MSNAAIKMKNRPSYEDGFITLNKECWIHQDSEMATPVIFFKDPANIDAWKGHHFHKFKVGAKIPADLWSTEFIYGEGEIHG